jgi:uncharacterized protein
MQILLVTAAILLAVVAPRDKTARVHDFADLLSAAERESLESLAQSVERQTTAQLAVVTVRSLEGKTVESYAHELFNDWGIGRQDVNNGVLLLVAPNERRMRIEVGYGLEPLLTDALCGQIRDQKIIPRFKQQDYAGGIVAGTREIAAVLRADPKAARGDPDSGPMLARTARRRAVVATSGVAVAAVTLVVLGFLAAVSRLYSTTAFATVSAVSLGALAVAGYLTWVTPKQQQPLGWLGGAGTASLAAWGFNLVRYRRYGPHGCSKCGTHLELLSEQDEDPKLSAVQQLEETIGSVDYDVWICPACLNNDTERYLKPFSSFRDCPACKARTFKEDPQVVIRHPTTTSSGTARVEGRCVACNHKTVRTVILSQLSEPSSSSDGSSFGGGGGGGFGGGSSGGGGASGGW